MDKSQLENVLKGQVELHNKLRFACEFLNLNNKQVVEDLNNAIRTQTLHTYELFLYVEFAKHCQSELEKRKRHPNFPPEAITESSIFRSIPNGHPVFAVFDKTSVVKDEGTSVTIYSPQEAHKVLWPLVEGEQEVQFEENEGSERHQQMMKDIKNAVEKSEAVNKTMVNICGVPCEVESRGLNLDTPIIGLNRIAKQRQNEIPMEKDSPTKKRGRNALKSRNVVRMEVAIAGRENEINLQNLQINDTTEYGEGNSTMNNEAEPFEFSSTRKTFGCRK